MALAPRWGIRGPRCRYLLVQVALCRSFRVERWDDALAVGRDSTSGDEIIQILDRRQPGFVLCCQRELVDDGADFLELLLPDIAGVQTSGIIIWEHADPLTGEKRQRLQMDPLAGAEHGDGSGVRIPSLSYDQLKGRQ